MWELDEMVFQIEDIWETDRNLENIWWNAEIAGSPGWSLDCVEVGGRGRCGERGHNGEGNSQMR